MFIKTHQTEHLELVSFMANKLYLKKAVAEGGERKEEEGGGDRRRRRREEEEEEKEEKEGGILPLKILPLKITSMNDVGSIKKEAPLVIQ